MAGTKKTRRMLALAARVRDLVRRGLRRPRRRRRRSLVTPSSLNRLTTLTPSPESRLRRSQADSGHPEQLELAPEVRLELSSNRIVQVRQDLDAIHELLHASIDRGVVREGDPESGGNVPALLHLVVLSLLTGEPLCELHRPRRIRRVLRDEEIVACEDDSSGRTGNRRQ